MQVIFSERFRRSYESAPPQIQQAFDRRIALLVRNLRHPSLWAKKYDEPRGIWQARVDGGVAVLFHHRGRRLPPARYSPPPEVAALDAAIHRNHKVLQGNPGRPAAHNNLA